jgi:hypothetical protein
MEGDDIMDGQTIAGETLGYLKTGIDDLMLQIAREPAWALLTAREGSPSRVKALMREVYAEIAAYQPDVIEATIAVIGQFPRSLAAKKVRAMLVHQSEEWDHGEMAVRDFVGLGHEEHLARGTQTPTAFATAACWRMFAHKRMPFAYLGGLYLFEGLTPLVTGLAKPHLAEQGMTPASLEYIEFHSTEDIRHAKVVDSLIRDVVAAFPDRAAEVRFGFDAFRQVYPLPGWRAAFARSAGVSQAA